MSAATLANVVGAARQAAATVAWRQWAEIGGMASADRRAQSLVDPEALVMVSLFLRDHERRLWDVILEWAELGVRLLSSQRMKNLRSAYDDETQARLAEFAAVAAREFGDTRWKAKFFGEPRPILDSRGRQWDVQLEFIGEPALMLRLRKAFGVNVKSDVLGFLIAMSGTHLSVRPIARALHYTEAGIRKAADDLGETRLIVRSADDRPTTYAADVTAWKALLELPRIPPWRHWNEVFAFVGALSDWEHRATGRDVSAFALNALGRELLEKHAAAFKRNEVPFDLAAVRYGEGATSGFADHVYRLTTWMVEAA